MFFAKKPKQKQTPRPATDYERWLNKDTPDSDSVPQFGPEQGVDDMHNHGERHSVLLAGGREGFVNSFDQYDPSTIPPPVQQEVTRRPRVPDIITYYGAVLILLFFVRYFMKMLLQQLRHRREEADHQFPTRNPHQ
ncbi:hypothetical protein BJY01DRAFT_40921 [Aspergillus pseudoustus]|uniref:Uncharacterized protein n=1 Tax=Aspergillus pseudoustus TaxID=1810923 RepID=A0ABR4JD86_9EURO